MPQIERKFESWRKNETVSLVRSYLASRDELTALSRIYKNKLKFLHRLMQDCKDMESAWHRDNDAPQRQCNDPCMAMTGRVDFAITTMNDLSEQCEQLVQNLTASLDAVSDRKSLGSLSLSDFSSSYSSFEQLSRTTGRSPPILKARLCSCSPQSRWSSCLCHS